MTKKSSILKFEIISAIFMMVVGTLLHFTFGWSNNNPLIGTFSAVNESIWEHMKILFTSILLYGFIDKYLLNKYNIKHNNFPFQLYFTAISSIPLYLAIYIPIYKLLGEKLIISLLLLLVVYIIEAYISYNLLKEKELKVLNLLAVPIILSTYIFFIY